MKRKNIVIGILVVLVIGLLVYLISNQSQETSFKKVTLSNNNIITNKTSKSYLDTLVSEGLDVLGLKSEFVTIKTMNPSFKGSLGSDNELRAFIIGQNNQYIIYVDDLSRHESLTVLSHELIHLEQYSSGRLIRMEQHFIMFNGEVFNVDNVPYKERPWEIEAFNKEKDLRTKLEKLLL
jgi:hypothetical protein